MFKDSSEVLKFIKDEDVKFLDIRFTDLPGVQQHFNIPASTVDEEFFTVGQLFDGSSIRGFANIHESDMQLIPDVSTAYLDQFREAKTLIMISAAAVTTRAPCLNPLETALCAVLPWTQPSRIRVTRKTW